MSGCEWQYVDASIEAWLTGKRNWSYIRWRFGKEFTPKHSRNYFIASFAAFWGLAK